MACISSVSYTVLLNGQMHGHIFSERGIRQGDPLSPFLFILCAEALVHVMNKAEQQGVITGMRLTKKCPSIEDREIWAYTKNGAYTVKTGYHLAAELARSPRQNASPCKQEVLMIQRKIWKTPTVPKICATVGTLAVEERLSSRGIPVDLQCKLYSAGVESIDHVLFQCDVAQEFWAATGIPSINLNHSLSFAKKLNILLELMADTRLSNESRRAIPWLLWTVWKNRDAIILAGTRDSLVKQVQLAVGKLNFGRSLTDHLVLLLCVPLL